ncbi:MAG: NADH-quinone oxidoreductase subunit C [Sphingomonadales bacterium]|nr:NADH-quinone oxidoreductase subunit C [Sphingomonadales bacterium]
MASPAPKFASNDGILDTLVGALGDAVLSSKEAVGEIALTVERDSLVATLTTLRDDHDYQQLMEIAGVDYPSRPERFEVVYCLLSLTRNHRIRIQVTTDEDMPVPSVTGLWPNAGWLEREVFDMYGVLFAGNTDLRRILTDYGFKGHPQRKDFPLTGYVELRYSETEKRVAYQPVELAQDFRTFDFQSPWEGAQYVLPGDEKAPQEPGAPSEIKSKEAADAKASESEAKAPPATPKTTDNASQTGAGKATDEKAAEPVDEVDKALKSEPAAKKPAPKKPAARRKPAAKPKKEG